MCSQPAVRSARAPRPNSRHCPASSRHCALVGLALLLLLLYSVCAQDLSTSTVSSKFQQRSSEKHSNIVRRSRAAAALQLRAQSTTADSADAAAAGVSALVSGALLQSVVDAQLARITSEVKNIDTEQFAVQGQASGFDYALDSLVVESLSVEKAIVSTSDTGVITLQLSGLRADVSLRYSWRLHSWPHVPRGEGRAFIHFAGNSIARSSAMISLATDGAPRMRLTECAVLLDGFSIRVSQSYLQWLVDVLGSRVGLQAAIRDKAQTAIAGALLDSGNAELDNLLSKYPLLLPLASMLPSPSLHVRTLAVNLSLTAAPLTDSIGLRVSISGLTTDTNHSQAAPVLPEIPLPHLPLTGSTADLAVAFSDNVVNSALAALYTSGVFTTVITQQMVPAEYQQLLNSSEWKVLCPPLYALYPNNLMRIHVSAALSPIAHFTPGAVLSVTAQPVLRFEVLSTQGQGQGHGEGGEWVPAFSLSSQLQAVLRLSFVNGSAPAATSSALAAAGFGAVVVSPLLVQAVQRCSVSDFALLDSAVGPFAAFKVVMLTEIAANQMFLGELEHMLSPGVVMPVLLGVAPTAALLESGDGTASVSMSVQLA